MDAVVGSGNCSGSNEDGGSIEAESIGCDRGRGGRVGDGRDGRDGGATFCFPDMLSIKKGGGGSFSCFHDSKFLSPFVNFSPILSSYRTQR